MTHHTRPVPLRRIDPSRLLFDPNESTRHRYVPAEDQAHDGILARWVWDRSASNPANYDDPDDAQRSAIADHASVSIRSDR